MSINDTTLSPTKQALLAVKTLQARLDALEQAQNEPLAIIGMACRFPGNAATPELYWQLLTGDCDAVIPISQSRWNGIDYYDPDTDNVKPGKTYVKAGGFLPEIDRFDADFFGISTREATMMDPQQRLVLEVAWEALERAGLSAADLNGTKTGVFIGMDNNDYSFISGYPFTRCDPYTGTGNYMSVAAGRLAYSLGLCGPAFTVDTACSSSLTAVHLACQTLRLEQCSLALVGGVFLMTTPYHAILNANAQALAPDGRCKTFDQAADGFGQGEGCGMIVIKRLSDARRDGDPVLALIRGSAINHDGRSSGLTVPNGRAQQQVIRQALAYSKVDAAQVGYIEAHGTGTALGDPIEVEAIGAVFQERMQPLWIGSAKPKIGHLDAAAGIAGLIKVVLCLQHQLIPAHAPFDQPNQRIPWAELPVAIPRSAQPFPQLHGTRLAGVSSFGMSGTNAHVVLEEAPNPVPDPAPDERLHPCVLPLSARSQPALETLLQRYRDHSSAHPELDLADVCFTASTGRSHFPYRMALVARSLEELQARLADAQAGRSRTGIVRGHARSDAKIAFLFTGQGSQYSGMGRELYETQPVFRQTLDRCAAILQPFLDISLIDLLYPIQPTDGDQHDAGTPAADMIHQTAYTQPALFAIEYALATLWQSWGIEPDFVLGHSVGEYVAACVAGVFSLEDGLKLIAARGKLMGALPQNGAMVAVMATEASIQAALQPYKSQVDLAAVNGSDNVVISGERAAVEAVVTELQATGIKTTTLHVSHAFHSPLMEPMLADFGQVAQTITYAAPTLPLVSNLTGKLVTAEITDPAYWVKHVRQPVRFGDGIETLYAQGCTIFLEIGPKPTLLGMLPDHSVTTADHSITVADSHPELLPSLRPDRSDWQQLLESLGALYVQGVRINWVGVDGRDIQQRRKVILPTYPFQRERYWVEESHPASAPPATQIVDWFNQGDVPALADLLQKTGDYAATDMPLLTDALTRLVAQHQAQLATQPPATQRSDWLYHLTWQLLEQHPPATAAQLPDHWLIFADRGGLGEAIARQLQAHHQTVHLVYAHYDGQEVTHATVLNPADPDDFVHLVQQPAFQVPYNIVHLWSLDATLPDPANDELLHATLAQDLLLSCGSVLHLIQAVSAQPVRLWVITRGAVATGDHRVAVNQSAVWGLGRVIALEYPDRWGGLIDLDHQPDSATAEADTLLKILFSMHNEDHLALRTGQVYVARTTPAPEQLAHTAASPLRADGTYLITGGSGGLGLQVARWLVACGARYLLLTSRRGASGREEEIRQLEQTGATVCIVQADIAHWQDAVHLMDVARASLPPVCGILHAAGTLDDGILQQQTWARFTRVMDAKVQGAWHLHRLSSSLNLDFFILFSSDTALLGTPGQGNYAAANAFMDALAHYRCALGLPALSINWGTWAHIGMSAQVSQQQHARWTEQGMHAIPVQQGLHLLGQLLNLTGQIAVLPHEWERFGHTATGQRPLLANLVQPQANASDGMFLTQLLALPARERHAALVEHLQTLVADVLGDRRLPEPARGFFELGMDSLMTVQLRNRLRTTLGIALPPTLAFEYPTIEKLTGYILQEIVTENESASVAVPPAPQEERQATAWNDIQGLSETELTALIDDELADLLKG